MFGALADAISGDDDCVTLAARARAVLDDHRELRAATGRAADHGHRRDLDRAVDAHRDRIAAAAARMQPALRRCGDDARFVDALTPFDT
jgi:hypothetical protein